MRNELIEAKSLVRRKKTTSIKRLSKKALDLGRLLYPPSVNRSNPRPKTYGECVARDLGDGCPYVSCKFNLFLDVKQSGNGAGSIIHNQPNEPGNNRNCLLRLVERGAYQESDIARLLGISRQRIDQILKGALRKIRDVLKDSKELIELLNYLENSKAIPYTERL